MMSSNDQNVSQPPQPPEVERKLQFHRLQLIGMPLIMLIPLLALFGLFGESFARASAASSAFDVQVEYADRYRYKMTNSLNISVRNMSAQSVPTVTVAIDRAYIEGFSEVSFTPQAKTVTDDDYLVELTDLPPEETRRITVSLQGEHYGWHRGRVMVSSNGLEPLEVTMATFIFP